MYNIPGRHKDSTNIRSIFVTDFIYGHHTGFPKHCNDKIILAILLQLGQL